MKKFYFVAVMVALAALGGCCTTDEENKNGTVAQTTLSIGLPVGISRTAIDDEGRASWTEGDTFALWAENANGESALNGVNFSMMYYWVSWQSAIFTANTTPMSEGTYTYYATAPKPESHSNGTATYTIPASQQGDSFKGVYDIMVATPAEADALSEERVNTLALDFHHKMHILKVGIAENNLGTEIGKLVFSFPSAVTGSVSVDYKNYEADATLANGSKELVIECGDGINAGETVWGVIFPQTISGNVNLTAYGVDGRQSITKNIALDKECLAGHITPLSLTVPAMCSTLRFSIGTNNLGEAIEKLTITGNNGFSTVFEGVTNNTYDYCTDTDSTTIFDQYEGQTFTATFESKSAIVSSTFTMPSQLGGGINVIPALTVPYLFEEDFSCIHTNAEKDGDDDQASNDTNQTGASLDNYMNHKGWSAARFKLVAGACPRINARAQKVIIWASQHHGRLDSPQLSNLKAGASVDIKLTFDAGGLEWKGGYADQDVVEVNVVRHTTTGVLNGIPVGATGISSSYDTTLADFGEVQFGCTLKGNYGLSSFSSVFPTFSGIISGATSTSRLCFYPTLKLDAATIGNVEVGFYIDNIKVSIAQ